MEERKDLVILIAFLLVFASLGKLSFMYYEQSKQVHMLQEEIIYTQAEMQGIRTNLIRIEKDK